MGERDYGALGQAQVRIIDFLFDGVNLDHPSYADVLANRLIGFAHKLNPGRFRGVSLRELAGRLGVSVQAISRHASDTTRTFGVRNGGDSHAWNRKAA